MHMQKQSLALTSSVAAEKAACFKLISFFLFLKEGLQNCELTRAGRDAGSGGGPCAGKEDNVICGAYFACRYSYGLRIFGGGCHVVC